MDPPSTDIALPPLEGDILLPGDTVRVLIAPHPFKTERLELDLPAGLSLAEIVERAAEHAGDVRLSRSFELTLGGHQVEPSKWRLIRPKAGMDVGLIAVPRGGSGGALKSIMFFALAVLTAVVAPYLAGFVFAAGTIGFAVATAAIGAAITIGGALPRDIYLQPATCAEEFP